MLRKIALFTILAVIVVGCSSGDGATADNQYQGSVSAHNSYKAGGKRDASAYLDLGSPSIPRQEGAYGDTTSLAARRAVPPAAQIQSRAAIRGATLQVRVENLDDAERKVQTAIKGNGGYEQTLTSSDLASPNAMISITAKVPVEKLDTVIASIEGLGTRLGKTISMVDVTENLMTWDARIKSLRDQQAEAKKRKSTYAGENDYYVQNLQQQINETQAQRDAQAKEVAYSTLQLTLRQGAVPGTRDPNWLTEAYGSSSAAASDALRVVATGFLWLVFMSPFYMPFVAGGWLFYRMRKRKLAESAPRMVNTSAPPSMQQI